MSNSKAWDRCECAHARQEHGRPRCMALDSYGIRCECREFIHDLSDEDGPDDDPNDFVLLRHVSREAERSFGECSALSYASNETDSR